MDEQLERLERAWRANPADRDAADAYERALLRADDRSALAEQDWFRLVCDQRWDDLAPTEDALVRSCAECERDVHFAWSVAELIVHAQAGRCVALLEGRGRRQVADMAREREAWPQGKPLPCVVQGNRHQFLAASEAELRHLNAPHPTRPVIGQPQVPDDPRARRLMDMVNDLLFPSPGVE